MGLVSREMRRNMKTLVTVVTLGALTAAPAFVQFANAQRFDTARERAIQDCMAMQKKYPTDPYSSYGGAEHMYHACMANKGQMP